MSERMPAPGERPQGYRVRIGGVMRCCLANDFPEAPQEGDVLPCKYCKDGLRLVTREPKHQGIGVEVSQQDQTAWEAAWITLGHDRRATPGAPPKGEPKNE